MPYALFHGALMIAWRQPIFNNTPTDSEFILKILNHNYSDAYTSTALTHNQLHSPFDEPWIIIDMGQA